MSREYRRAYERQQIVADHVCACNHDDPGLAVISTRQGPQHISVRFWDDPMERSRHTNAEILLDGKVVYGVFEAILGEQGTLWRYRGVPSASEQGKHRCMTCEDRNRAAGIEVDQDGAPRGMPEVQLCVEKLTGAVELKAKARMTCPACEFGGDWSHTYAQGICTGGRGDFIAPE